MELINRRPFNFEEFQAGTIGVTGDGQYVKFKEFVSMSKYPIRCKLYKSRVDLIDDKEILNTNYDYTVDGKYNTNPNNGFHIVYMYDVKKSLKHKEEI